MTTRACGTAQLGDVIAAVFDEAARYSTDPKQVARLATRAVQHLLRHSRVRSRVGPNFAHAFASPRAGKRISASRTI